jgi:hypothetical protein
MVHRVGHEIVHRYNAYYRGRKCGGKLRLSHVGEVLYATDLKVMNFGVKGVANLFRRPGEIDRPRIDHIDREAAILQP